MSFLTQSLYVALSGAAIKHKYEALKTSLDYDEYGDVTKEKLLTELTSAEGLYGQLIGRVSDRKLGSLRLKIDYLKSKIQEDMIDHVHEHDGVSDVELDFAHPQEHVELDGMVITPPLFEDLYHELEQVDEEHEISEDIIDKFRNQNQEEMPTQETGIHLLHIAPPPSKSEF